MSFLKGIEPNTFLNTHEEWHAFIFGLCEVLCPWPPRHKTMSPRLARQVKNEHHYYMLGRAAAILAWITICCVIAAVLT